MAEVNPRDRTVKVKIVYYGPPLGGKTTNLHVLQRHALASRRGEMISVNSLQDRTILFDLLPIKTIGLRGFDLRLQLLAVPGQATYAATRRVALKGADGVVFVANSAADRWEENQQSFREMTHYLLAHQIDPAAIPLVVQYNKRDLPEVTPVEVMDRHLNPRREQSFPAVATRGEGVLETLRAILARTLADLTRRFRALELPQGMSAEDWAGEAVAGMFGRETLAAPPPTASGETETFEIERVSSREFGIPAEFELTASASTTDVAGVEPGIRTIRVPVGDPAPHAGKPARHNPAAIAESYAEACSALALDLTEARAERDLSRERLDEIRRAVAAARQAPAGEADARLRQVLAAIGDGTDAGHAALALWDEARSAEAELQRQREALQQSEKLAAMGTLLAGVAHELNNPLTVLMGQAELLREATAGSRVADWAERIVRAAERCARIVRNFLALARQRPEERQQVDLNQVVREAVELVSYPLRADGVELRLDLASALPAIWADPHQLHQVVVNLVTNAQQAMRSVDGHRQIVIGTHAHGSARVLLRVSDTGPGIPPEIQARIFEPFFTTKPQGQGTGLGLSLCHGIVRGHGGEIRVEGEPGRGASFVVELPVGSPAEEPVEPAPTTPAEAAAKRILVVDDEPELAALLGQLLSGDGHLVETAENGRAALEKIEQRPFDVVLSDMRMPVLDGPGLYRSVEKRHPELLPRLVFLTGDTISAESSAFLERTGATVLDKPFDFQEVRRAVRHVTEEVPAQQAAALLALAG